jgi:hypothetical protein
VNSSFYPVLAPHKGHRFLMANHRVPSPDPFESFLGLREGDLRFNNDGGDVRASRSELPSASVVSARHTGARSRVHLPAEQPLQRRPSTSAADNIIELLQTDPQLHALVVDQLVADTRSRGHHLAGQLQVKNLFSSSFNLFMKLKAIIVHFFAIFVWFLFSD